MRHEMLLIIIILNVFLLPFYDDTLYKDDFTRSFYSHFHHHDLSAKQYYFGCSRSPNVDGIKIFDKHD